MEKVRKQQAELSAKSDTSKTEAQKNREREIERRKEQERRKREAVSLSMKNHHCCNFFCRTVPNRFGSPVWTVKL